jgi:hypothetical protein
MLETVLRIKAWAESVKKAQGACRVLRAFLGDDTDQKKSPEALSISVIKCTAMVKGLPRAGRLQISGSGFGPGWFVADGPFRSAADSRDRGAYPFFALVHKIAGRIRQVASLTLQIITGLRAAHGGEQYSQAYANA